MASAIPPRRLSDGPAFVQTRYGTARGLTRLMLSRLSHAVGRYRRFEAIDWTRVERLVFVCAGNICRSPYADRKAAQSGFPTAGIAMRGGTGLPADPQARRAALDAGVNLDDHRSLALADFNAAPGDLLVAMEPHQAFGLATHFAANAGVQVTLLGLWSRPPRPHLHDPHSLNAAYFRTCFRTIDSGVETILRKLA